MAELTVRGADTDFPAILAAYDAVAEWVESNGHRRVGPPREIWESDGAAPVMTVSWAYA